MMQHHKQRLHWDIPNLVMLKLPENWVLLDKFLLHTR